MQKKTCRYFDWKNIANYRSHSIYINIGIISKNLVYSFIFPTYFFIFLHIPSYSLHIFSNFFISPSCFVHISSYFFIFSSYFYVLKQKTIFCENASIFVFYSRISQLFIRNSNVVIILPCRLLYTLNI